MSTASHILQLLKENRMVTVPGFGEFYIAPSHAKIDTGAQSILPPSQEIRFRADYTAAGGPLVAFIAEKQNITTAKAESELKNLTDYWKNLLHQQQNADIPELGTFSHKGDEIVFSGKRITAEHPDFFGLEAVKISQLKNKPGEGAYKVNRPLLWTAAVAIPLIAAATATFASPEQIFGKASQLHSKKAQPAPVIKSPDSARIGDSAGQAAVQSHNIKTGFPAKYNINGAK